MLGHYNDTKTNRNAKHKLLKWLLMVTIKEIHSYECQELVQCWCEYLYYQPIVLYRW